MSRTPIDTYIKKYPPEIQQILENVRQTIRKIAPDAVETISYGIPTFDLNKKHLVHFAAFKMHIGFFPTASPIPYFSKELQPYKTSKGTIQFPINKEIPYDLIKKITQFRIDQLEKEQDK